MNIPRVVIAALRGGSGKTVLSTGIIAALREQDQPIAPFKKGPDYIDAGWLALSAGRPCYNLDTFLCPPVAVRNSFLRHTQAEDFAVIEGNRGLFDGIDLAGKTSTAELAKLLQAPVIFCIDCTKSTRTMAAALMGCISFDPEVQIKGVVLNRVAGPRHESILRRSVESFCNIPVVGAIYKLPQENFPERHMGLTPAAEHQAARKAVDAAAQIAHRYIDLEAVVQIAQSAAPLSGEVGVDQSTTLKSEDGTPPVRLGIIKDSAFQFYYPDNLEALERAGAELVYISPLASANLNRLDGIYLGGGFPETHVEPLSANDKFRAQLKALAEAGLPIYAECGGLMYLGQAIVLNGVSYPMAGVLPLVCDLSKRPQGHGYTILNVERPNPYFEVGTELRGHEFHYSRIIRWEGSDADLALGMQRGVGFMNQRDGISFKNVLALYTHVHALGTCQWAPALVAAARAWQQKTGPAKQSFASPVG